MTIGLKKGFIHSLIVVVLLLPELLGCHTSPEVTPGVDFPRFTSLKEAEDWCESNLRYENDDPWDRAPDLKSVFKDKHGDCKMLSGAVHEVLKSVGQESKIVTIETPAWHMFVIYKENENWRVINNGKLYKKVFASLDDIKAAYHVREFIHVSDSYDEFRSWFNNDIYPMKKGY